MCQECGADILRDGTPHVCSPEGIATMRTMRTICRPCVRCGVPSTRSEGCPVMWCQQCHVFWNWDTGRLIETRRRNLPHNPDHRQWVQSEGFRDREIDDVPCGGLVDVPALHGAFLREFTRSSDTHTKVGIIMNATESIFRAQRLRFDYAQQNDERVLIEFPDTASDALVGRILEKRERDASYTRDVATALETYVLSGTDILQRFCALHDDSIVTSENLEALCAIVDARLMHVAGLYSRVTPRISSTFVWSLPYTRRRTYG